MQDPIILKREFIQQEKVEIKKPQPANTNNEDLKVETVKKCQQILQPQSDNLPESSPHQSVEGPKSPPDKPSPITNINQKLQDAMSSFFQKFKKT